jgi:DNA invertase Pin-like site-specific DNA recombinase
MRLIKEQVFTLMLYLAQKEREKISQRTKEALAVKKLQGIVLGRPESQKPTDEIINAYNSGESYNSLCTTYGLARGTVAKIIKEAANKGLC